MRKALGLVLALALVIGAVAAGVLFWLQPGALPQQPGRAGASNATTQVINAGEYLARAGDCVACHTDADRQAVRRRPGDGRRRSATSTFPTSRPTTRPASASGPPTSSTE